MTKTRDALRVFWNGEEVAGVTVYGFWTVRQASCPSVVPSSVGALVEEDQFTLHGEGWHVCGADLKVSEWPRPDQWNECIRSILQRMMDGDAWVAWCGFEGMFVDPPGLLSPEQMSGGVWAALTRQEYFPPPDLDGELETLSDEVLQSLSEVVQAAMSNGR